MQTHWHDAPDVERTPAAQRRVESPSQAHQAPNGGGPLRLARRIGIGVVGSLVLGVGVVMLVMPGPAFVVIPMGLGILALEFEWARRWLKRVKDYARGAFGKDDGAATPRNT
jgi:tellurite resistance protein TerC